MYTGICILSILQKHQEENIGVHVSWVLYSQFSLEAESGIHRYTCILGSVFSVFPWKQKEENRNVHVCWVLYSQYSLQTDRQNKKIYVHVYWVLYFQYSLETESRKHRGTCILNYAFSLFSGNRKRKT